MRFNKASYICLRIYNWGCTYGHIYVHNNLGRNDIGYRDDRDKAAEPMVRLPADLAQPQLISAAEQGGWIDDESQFKSRM